nr:hypothetical protein [uncultured archaeon]AQS34156.1 hypothetical protein [uncultured archaeon]
MEYYELELNPEFIKKTMEIEKQKTISFKSIEELRKRIEKNA